jgi:hypothetical protein
MIDLFKKTIKYDFTKNINAYKSIEITSTIPVCVIAQYMTNNKFSQEIITDLLEINLKSLKG